MTLFAFILFGHICIEVPGDLDKCWNIIHKPQIYYISERTCIKAGRSYISGAQQYYKRKKRSISELELYCFKAYPQNNL